jgi:hypothetical protein
MSATTPSASAACCTRTSAPESVRASEISNGTLNDEDIAQPNGNFVNFTATIGRVPANSCVYRHVTGVSAAGDHLLLTPNFETTLA